MLMLADKPLLSIIVPNYNNALYIRDCVDSIIAQSYRNIEIIISDDASTDGSATIIRSYEQLDGNIRCIYHDKNRGVSFNRHSAIVQARGEYISTIDSDDYYCNEKKLEKEMEIVLAYREKYGKDVCAFSNIVQVTGENQLIQVVGTSENIREGLIFDGIITRSCFIPRDFIFSKLAYLDAGGFDTSLKIYEDWDLKIRLSARHEFYYSGINGIGYRRHGKGLSSVPLTEHVESLEKIFRKNIHLASEVDKQSILDRFGIFMGGLLDQAKRDDYEQLKSVKTKAFFEQFRNKFRSIFH